MRTYAHSRHGAPQPRHVAVAASPCAATRLRPKSRVSAGSLQSLIPTQRESESLNSKLVLACMPSWAWRSVLASPRPSGLVSCVLCRVLSLLVSLIARLLCLALPGPDGGVPARPPQLERAAVQVLHNAPAWPRLARVIPEGSLSCAGPRKCVLYLTEVVY